jgi:hypothetical protein
MHGRATNAVRLVGVVTKREICTARVRTHVDNCSVRYRFRLFIVGIGIGSLRWARIRNSMLSISACVYCPGIIIMPTGDLRSEAF